MQTFKTFMTRGAATALLWCVASAAQADVIVSTDSGTIGAFQLTNNGGGSMTLNLDGTEQLTNINGVSVGPFTANFDASIAMTFSPSGPNEYTINTSNTLTKTFFDDAGSTASFHYNITAAETSAVFTDDALLGGKILGLVTNSFSGYDFSHLNGAQNFALTATSYGGGATTLDSVFTTPGGIARGAIAFSESSQPQIVTPVPSTLLMAVSTLVGVFVLRAFKRPRLKLV